MIAQAGPTVLIVALLSLLVSTASAAPAGGDAAYMKAASDAVDTIARDDGFSGVILVARGDQVLLRKAAGFADRERRIPNTPETKYPLASVTKQFTAAAIMLLVEEGKVSLEDPISKYYPASPPAWRDVKIKHLLSNRSGIEDYWIHRGGLVVSGELWRSHEELIQLAINDPLGFEPGAGFSYSNTGFALLTMVIERVSGQRYADFMRSRIFAPLGMLDTGYGPPPDNTVRDYLPSAQGELLRTEFLSRLNAYGGFGGIYSTLDDMLTWSLVLFGGKVLSADAQRMMLTDYGHNYGFGWRFAPKFGRPLIWHTGAGSNTGFAAIFDYFPDDDLTIVVMTNNTSPTSSTAALLIEGKVTTFPANAARKLVERVEQLYFGRAP